MSGPVQPVTTFWRLAGMSYLQVRVVRVCVRDERARYCCAERKRSIIRHSMLCVWGHMMCAMNESSTTSTASATTTKLEWRRGWTLELLPRCCFLDSGTSRVSPLYFLAPFRCFFCRERLLLLHSLPGSLPIFPCFWRILYLVREPIGIGRTKRVEGTRQAQGRIARGIFVQGGGMEGRRVRNQDANQRVGRGW